MPAIKENSSSLKLGGSSAYPKKSSVKEVSCCECASVLLRAAIPKSEIFRHLSDIMRGNVNMVVLLREVKSQGAELL